LFSAVAKTAVRVLTLDQEFFLNSKDFIVGLADCIEIAEDFIVNNQIPLCDFKLHSKKQMTPIEKFRRATNHVITLNKLNRESKEGKFFTIIKHI
jgi:hypothetical protein